MQGYPISQSSELYFLHVCVCAWRRHARLSITCILYPHQTASLLSLLGHRACRSFASQTPPDRPLSHPNKLLPALRTRLTGTDALQCALHYLHKSRAMECPPNLNRPCLPMNYDCHGPCICKCELGTMIKQLDTGHNTGHNAMYGMIEKSILRCRC